MKRGFRGWVVHFGSCSAVAVPPRPLAVVASTGVGMVLGYAEDVGWVESASTDLLLLSALQEYVDLRKMWAAFQRNYASLVQRTGLTAYVG